MSKRTTNNGKPHIHKPERRTECPISLARFLDMASPVEVTIDGASVSGNAEPREFSTGSFGYFINGKVTLKIGGVDVKFQLSGNLIAVGSKDAPRS